MITGMTGFGAADFNVGKAKGMVEIKTVNHRYLDVAFYLPSGFASLEERIQKVLSKNLSRGRVTVSIKITEKPQVNIVLNQEAVKRYIDFSKSLGKQFNLKNDLTVADIMRLPGVVEAKESFVEAAQAWDAVEKALNKSINSVVAMRNREGRALCGDIGAQLKLMLSQIALIKSRSGGLLKVKKTELSNEEFASFEKSNDVNEELARLAHYIEEARALLRSSDGAGKKMDFIAQEMQRETNTIGSKVQDKEVSAAVIALKSKIEKIREQANNVE